MGQSAKPMEDFQPDDVLRKGFLEKQSKYNNSWRKRFIILTKTHLITYNVKDGRRSAVTKSIPLKYEIYVEYNFLKFEITYVYLILGAWQSEGSSMVFAPCL